ncbi:MAG: ilvA [Patescibacteria group bacterium]|nr:ilvA [Patescibacteria group bacterium]
MLTTSEPIITMSEIEQAADRLAGVARRTSLEYSAPLSERYGAKIYLKREDLQLGGSYKIRGAYNLMAGLSAAEQQLGVVAASSGNHGLAVALAAARLQIHATIYLPFATPLAKATQLRRLGGGWVTVRLAGRDLDASLIAARHAAVISGATLVHPFDDARIIAGQGTIAPEILAQLPAAPQLVVAPIGGGGLIGGLGAYFQAAAPGLRLIGVRPAAGDTIASSVVIKTRGRLTSQLAALIHQELTVSDTHIRRAQAELEHHHGIAAEPAGALATAALFQLAESAAGQTIVVIISGRG